MNIVLVGDLFIPGKSCRDELEGIVERYGGSYKIIEWETLDLEELNRRNVNIEKNGPGSEELPAQLRQVIKDADILIVQFCPVSEDLISAAEHLKVIGTMRTGLSNIDIAAARRRNIEIVNVSGRLSDSVSEFTVGLLISEMRNIARSHEALRSGEWGKDSAVGGHAFELAGKTIGLIGFGEIGKKVAKKISGFDMRTVACDPLVTEDAMKAQGVKKVDLQTLLRESDVVSIHTSLSESTTNLIGEAELRQMKRTAVLVNTARAAIVNKEALYKALLSKSIAGAAIDVFWNEPLDPTDPILRLDNITVTAHLAGSTEDALSRSFSKLNVRLDPHYQRLSGRTGE